MNHDVYGEIVKAIQNRKLREQFFPSELEKACPHLNKNTCRTFVAKHRVRNPGNETELFHRLDDGRYRLIRPIKYNL